MQFQMLSALVTACAAASVLASPLAPGSQLANRSSGDVDLHKRFSDSRWSFYDVGLGACGETNVASDFIVALNADQYGSGYPGPSCSKTITLTYNGKTAQATIMDRCPGCPYGGLDLSRGLFDYFAAESVGIIYGEWEFNDSASTTTTKAAATTTAAAVKVAAVVATTTSHTASTSTSPAAKKVETTSSTPAPVVTYSSSSHRSSSSARPASVTQQRLNRLASSSVTKPASSSSAAATSSASSSQATASATSTTGLEGAAAAASALSNGTTTDTADFGRVSAILSKLGDWFDNLVTAAEAN